MIQSSSDDAVVVVVSSALVGTLQAYAAQGTSTVPRGSEFVVAHSFLSLSQLACNQWSCSAEGPDLLVQFVEAHIRPGLRKPNMAWSVADSKLEESDLKSCSVNDTDLSCLKGLFRNEMVKGTSKPSMPFATMPCVDTYCVPSAQLRMLFSL